MTSSLRQPPTLNKKKHQPKTNKQTNKQTQAAHFLAKAGVSAIRRLRKTDANRVARACGATVVHRPEEIRDSDIGTVRQEEERVFLFFLL